MVERFSFGSIPSTLFAQVLWLTCAVCCGCPPALVLLATIGVHCDARAAARATQAARAARRDAQRDARAADVPRA